MFTLGGHILEYNVFPLLNTIDLLHLSETCKDLNTLVAGSLQWNNRYQRDFPFDSIKLNGQGKQRYCQRASAKLVQLTSSADSPEPLAAWPSDCLDKINAGPIVDFQEVSIHYDQGLMIRRLNGDVELVTRAGLQKTIAMHGVACISTHDTPRGGGLRLRGLKDNEIIMWDITMGDQDIEISQTSMAVNCTIFDSFPGRLEIPEKQRFNDWDGNLLPHEVTDLNLETILEAVPGMLKLNHVRANTNSAIAAVKNVVYSHFRFDQIQKYHFNAGIQKINFSRGIYFRGDDQRTDYYPKISALDVNGKYYAMHMLKRSTHNGPASPQPAYENVVDFTDGRDGNTLLLFASGAVLRLGMILGAAPDVLATDAILLNGGYALCV